MSPRLACFLALLLPSLSLAATPPATIRRAACRAELDGTALRVDVSLRVALPAKGQSASDLCSTDVPLVGAPPSTPNAAILARAGSYRLVLTAADTPKETDLAFAFRAQSRRYRGWRVCRVPVIPAAAVRIDLPATLHDLKVSPDAPLERSGDRIVLHAPAAGWLTLRWHDEPVPPATPAFRVSSSSRAVLSLDRMMTRSEHTVQVLQGELDRLRFDLPEGAELRAIAGGAIERWELDGRRVLLRFRRPEQRAVRFAVTTQAIGKGAFPWQPATFEGAGHQDGRVQFRAAAGLQLQVPDRVGLERLSNGRAVGGQQAVTLAYARLPASARLEVERVRPRVEAAVATLSVLERGVVTQRARVDYTIHDAGVRQFRLRVGQGADLLDVACEGLLDHDLLDGVLTIRLRDAVQKPVSLTLALQRLLERVDGVLIPRVEPLDVERQSCLVGIAAKGKVELRHARAVEADQVDVALLPEWVRKGSPRLAYRVFDRPDALVAVETEPLRAEVDAAVSDTCVLRDDGWERRVVWTATISRGEVFSARAALPEGVRPLSVSARLGKRSILDDWDFDEQNRRLAVRFVQAQRKGFAIEARFTQPEGDLRAIPLEDVRRVTGALTVQPRPGVVLKPTRESGIEARPGSEGRLAFAFREAPWELDLAFTQLEPVISVRSVAVLGVRQGQASADAVVTFTIEKAPVNVLRLRLPEGAVNSSVQAPQIKTSELRRGEWVLDLDRKLLGSLAVRVHYDHVLGPETCVCGVIGTPQAARHEGFVVVARDSDRVELAARGPGQVDVANVPRVGGLGFGRPLITAFRHTGTGGFDLDVTLLAQAEVLQAKALGAILETIVKADGQTLTELTCDIRNANRQFLQVDLPKDATLLGAYVDGQPVNVTISPSGGTLIPLLAAGGTSEVTEVACVYAQESAPLGRGRTVALTSPPVDVRTEAFSWAVYLPKGYRASDTDGNMKLMVQPPAEQELDPSLHMLADEGRALRKGTRVSATAFMVVARWVARVGPIVLKWVVILTAIAAAAFAFRKFVLPWLRRIAVLGCRHLARHPLLLGIALTFLFILACSALLLPALTRIKAQRMAGETMPSMSRISVGFAEDEIDNESPDDMAAGDMPAPTDMFTVAGTDSRTTVEYTEARRIVERYKSEVHEVRGRLKGGAGHRIVSGKFAESDDLRGPGSDRDEAEETREGGKRKPDGWKYEHDLTEAPTGTDAKDGKARVANEAREYLRQGRELLARKDYDKAIEALGRSGALATYQGGEAGAAITSEAERSIALALKGMKETEKEEERLKTQLEGQIKAGEKLDYGQKKLLDRITTRRSRVAQAATTPGLADVEAPTEDMPPRRPPAKVVPETEPEPAEPDAGRPPGVPKDAKPTEERRPDKDMRPAPQLRQPTRYRYSPVRGGRQKGALPIAFDLPRDAGLPYVFHRPVTGEARAEIELDCRLAADSNTARGIFILGALGLLGLAALPVLKRRRQ
jgi:hypothetical protein